jgi:hypothetical protein
MDPQSADRRNDSVIIDLTMSFKTGRNGYL